MQGTISVPNLVLRTFLANSEVIGNGMKRLTIVMDGKNASSKWYSYSLDEHRWCTWRLGGGPTLETIEGYTYKPVIEPNIDCGPKNTFKLVPPGASFTWTGDDFDKNQGFWSWVLFDVPQNATPKNITFPYYALDKDWKATSGSLTTQVLQFTEYELITSSIDSAYGLKIYNPDNEINFGSLAKLKFQLGDESDDTRTVTLELKSLDKGYPLELDYMSHIYLLYQDGVLCCDSSIIFSWGWTSSLGPNQSATLQKNIIMRNGKVWIIGDITLQEAVQNGQSENQVFVLQIP
jgi:hypothetical protein